MKKIFLLLIAFSLYLGIQAQVNPKLVKHFTEKYDAYINSLLTKIPEIPAVAVVVIKNNEPVFIKAYGMADREAGIRADKNTLFYIASSTKSFTALAAALLDKERLIKLDDPVTSYTNGIVFKNEIPKKITVQDLLTHTSGLQNEPLTIRMAYTGEINQTDITRVLGEATRYTDSNYNKFNYDNLGYNIYAMLLKQTLNKDWQDLLQEKIFGPLKMDHTTSYVSKAINENRTIAYPYMYTGDKGEIRTWLEKKDNNMQSAGGIFASISDIGRWLNVNMNKGKLNGRQIFAGGIIDQCQTGYAKTVKEPAPFAGDGEYGLGWQLGSYKNEKVIYHHGGFPGYRSHISFLPGKKIAVAVLINDATIGGRAGHLLATYAYDWWLRMENIDEAYAKQLESVANSFAKTKQSLREGFSERAKRTWQLSMPVESYTGKYYNSIMGTIELYCKDNVLAIRMGNMQCVSTPYTESDAIRVEMIPGTGQVLKFTKNEDKIEAAIIEGFEFRKIK